MKMRKLPSEYRKNGYLFRQIKRSDRVVIAEQILPETGKRIAYEVFEIAVRPPMGDLPMRETPPSSSTWGISGFSVSNRAQAEQFFDRLLRRRVSINSLQCPELQ